MIPLSFPEVADERLLYRGSSAGHAEGLLDDPSSGCTRSIRKSLMFETNALDKVFRAPLDDLPDSF